MSLLARVLGIGSEPPSPRERLEAAEKKLAVASAELDQVEQIIADAARAHATVKRLKAQVASASGQWSDIVALDDAQHVAQAAAVEAAKAQETLPKFTEAVEKAAANVSAAKSEIENVKAKLLLAEIAPLATAISQARAAYLRAWEPLAALELLTRPSWGPAHVFSQHRNYRVYQSIVEILGKNYLHTANRMELRARSQPTDEQLRERAESWATFCQGLLRDAEQL
jgi:DNA repair exonuclease SbcCD ATPase subunit